MVDVFLVALVCDVELGLGRMGGVCLLRYMLDCSSVGGDGWRWTASLVLTYGA